MDSLQNKKENSLDEISNANENKISESQEYSFILAQLTREIFTGPLPPPEILEKYKSIYPEALQVIFDEFKKQGDHRRSMTEKIVSAGIKSQNLGQWLGFIIALVGLIGSFFLISIDKSVYGIATLCTSLAVLVTSIVRKKPNNKNSD